MKTFIIFLHPTSKRMTLDLVQQHVEHLRALNDCGQYVLGGPFIDEGQGMIVLRAEHLRAAEEIAERDPFVMHRVRSYTIRELEVANVGNNYLLKEK